MHANKSDAVMKQSKSFCLDEELQLAKGRIQPIFCPLSKESANWTADFGQSSLPCNKQVAEAHQSRPKKEF